VIRVAEVRAAWKLCTQDAVGVPANLRQVKNYLYTCTKGFKIVSGGPGNHRASAVEALCDERRIHGEVVTMDEICATESVNQLAAGGRHITEAGCADTHDRLGR
jgi:hypothetical protein